MSDDDRHATMNECPRCGQVVTSGVEHVCEPLLTPEQVDEIERKAKPKSALTPIHITAKDVLALVRTLRAAWKKGKPLAASEQLTFQTNERYMPHRYGCCSLVAAINAAIFLGLPRPSEETVEQLVDLAGCRYGSALTPQKAYSQLGLTAIDGHYGDVLWACLNLPVEVSVQHPSHGFHSILIIEIGYGGFRIVDGNEVGTLSVKQMHEWAIRCPNERNNVWRSFKGRNASDD